MTAAPPPWRRHLARRAPLAAGLAAIAAVALAWWPESSTLLRADFLAALAATVGALALAVCLRGGRVAVALRWTLAAIAVLALALLLGPGRGCDRERLRARYVTGLPSWLGTPYVWGGENGRGIDCSGLVRRALVDAALGEGLATANPRLIRAGLALWWGDRSARALGDGAGTRQVATAPSLEALAATPPAPGDLAVSDGGVHVLAHLGDGLWIQAEPGAATVVLSRGGQGAPFFAVPVRIMRWDLLAGD